MTSSARRRQSRRPWLSHWSQFVRSTIGPGRYSSSGQRSSVCSEVSKCLSRTSSSISSPAGRSPRTSTGRMNRCACATTSSSKTSFSRLKQFTYSSMPGPETELKPASAARNAPTPVSMPACGSLNLESESAMYAWHGSSRCLATWA